MRRLTRQRLALVFGAAAFFGNSFLAQAAELKLSLPLPRTAYQTNEVIGISILRSSDQTLPASNLVATLTGENGSKMTFVFPAEAVQVAGGKAVATEHLRFNGWLLRPGKYTLEVTCDGATGKTEFNIYTHVRESTFKLVNWGNPGDEQGMRIQGEDSFGYNLMYSNAGFQKTNGNAYIPGGVDQMSVCTMSGGHQMDLRSVCDWSDPLVLQGGTRRAVRRALADRTDPNILGIHFYDEPGLTWLTDPENKKTTPHYVPSQMTSFQSAFGHLPIKYTKVNPNKAEDVNAWTHWAKWKLGFMDAAWKDAQLGVSMVNASYLSATQSQYGCTAFTDGYYFNVVRSLPVISGHGGYDDYGPGYYNPSCTLEIARGRDYYRPDWYLPLWYGGTEPNRARCEQYLSFITHVEGMITPPDMEPSRAGTQTSGTRQAFVESNQLMKRLGTVFAATAVTREPVAFLFSLSDVIKLQTTDMDNYNYSHATPQGKTIDGLMLAGVEAGYHLQTVVDEDVIDGSVAADRKAVIVSGIKYLAPPVIKGLEDFAAHGGLVLTTSDTTVKIAGATPLGAAYVTDEAGAAAAQAQITAAGADKAGLAAAQAKLNTFTSLGADFKNALPLAKALKEVLGKAGIKPVLTSDHNEIAVSRQGAGDVEYVFAVNSSFDYKVNSIFSMAQDGITAHISIPTGGRPIYDAVVGGEPVGLNSSADSASGEIRFGPGQLHAYAITARPIGGVKVVTPTLFRDFTLVHDPIQIRLGATVLDNKGGVLGGSIPLEFEVIDPLGDVRYTSFRATAEGVINFALPLAANDPAGTWKIVVHELLGNTTDAATFSYNPASQCGAIAGTAQRALFLPGEDDNVFRFGRNHQDVTIVVGSSAFDASAAERVKNFLVPWGMRAKIVKAADVNKGRTIAPNETETWTGLEFTGNDSIKPGDGNPPELVGFAVDGPVILIGNPDENPLIAFLNKAQFLPYVTKADLFPGRARGHVAWQRDAMGRDQESVALIAYDEAGMAEAAGTFYEMIAGIQPLTKTLLPDSNTLAPATVADSNHIPAKLLGRTILPDRVIGFKVEGESASVLTLDGTITTYSISGKTKTLKTVEGDARLAAIQEYGPPAADNAVLAGIKDSLVPNRLVKQVVSGNGLTVVTYWGGTMQVLSGGKQIVREQLPQDPTAVAFIGGKLVVGLATGEVLVFDVK